jgi:hypothetical protein
MSHTPLPESDKPWMSGDAGFHQTYYPMSWGKKNSYVLFSPGIDRFFLVDSYDPWIVFETGRILSSKCSNVVYILDQVTPDMDNSNCLEFTTSHKMVDKQYGGPIVYAHRQSTIAMKIKPNMMVHRGWPEEFQEPDRKAMLLKLQEYALFSLRVVHALTAALCFRNSFTQRSYIDTFFNGEYPKDFIARVDGTSSDEGIESSIKTILYESDSVEEALERIHNSWRSYTSSEVTGIRQFFYYNMQLEQPKDLYDLGNIGNLDKDKNQQTMWVA